jgi:hypothetical protein
VLCAILPPLPLILLKKSLHGHKEKQKAFFYCKREGGGGEGGEQKAKISKFRSSARPDLTDHHSPRNFIVFNCIFGFRKRAALHK